MIKLFTILILFTVISACSAVDHEFAQSDSMVEVHKMELRGY